MQKMMQHVFLAATLVVAGSFQTAYGQCTTPGSLAAAPDGSGNMILSWSDTGADSYTLNLEDAPVTRKCWILLTQVLPVHRSLQRS